MGATCSAGRFGGASGVAGAPALTGVWPDWGYPSPGRLHSTPFLFYVSDQISPSVPHNHHDDLNAGIYKPLTFANFSLQQKTVAAL